VVEALFRAYFTDGHDISNRVTLIDVVAKAGLDRGKAEGVLNGEAGLLAIEEAYEQAQRIPVEGVPFFMINGQISLSGAQPPKAFLAAFDQARAAT
jgi:predicted DsbA family dithiol-disulfide isomerase